MGLNCTAVLLGSGEGCEAETIRFVLYIYSIVVFLIIRAPLVRWQRQPVTWCLGES
jgi:hypothetical protein